MEISRRQLLDLVDNWAEGNLSEIQVHEIAEEIWGKEDWPNYPEDDPRSIALGVVSYLEVLNYQLVTEEDIPIIVDFLNTPKGKEKNGWVNWRRYWERLDLETRKQELKNNPYYST